MDESIRSLGLRNIYYLYVILMAAAGGLFILLCMFCRSRGLYLYREIYKRVGLDRYIGVLKQN